MHYVKTSEVVIRHNEYVFSSPYRKREVNCESRIEVYPEFQDALDDLEGFSHIFVLSYFSKLRPDQIGVLKVGPRRLLSKGFELIRDPCKIR